MKHFATFVLAAACLAAPSLFAQSQTAPVSQTEPAPQTAASAPACAGTAGIVRISEVKAGKMDIFLQAVELQSAWYKAHGMADHIIYAARMYDRDAVTGAMTASDTQAMSFHLNPTSGVGAPHDEAYGNFVKMFKDSSSIKSEYYICTTKKM